MSLLLLACGIAAAAADDAGDDVRVRTDGGPAVADPRAKKFGWVEAGFRVGQVDWPTEDWECKKLPLPSTADEFEMIIQQRRPVIFHAPGGVGDALGWKTDKWADLSYWKERVPSNTMVEVETNNLAATREGTPKFGHHTLTKRVRFKDWLKKIETAAPGSTMDGTAWYLNIAGADADKGQLQDILASDYDEPSWLKRLYAASPYLASGLNITADSSQIWWGHRHPIERPQGHDATDLPDGTSMLHFDTYENLNTCIVGRKRFTLFAPVEAAHAKLVGGAVFVAESGEIIMNQLNTDFGASSTVAAAAMPGRKGVCDVSAGEMLYIPKGFLHEVQSFASPETGFHLSNK